MINYGTLDALFDTLPSSNRMRKVTILLITKKRDKWQCGHVLIIYSPPSHTTSEMKYECSTSIFFQCAVVILIDNINIAFDWGVDPIFYVTVELWRLVAVRSEGALD